MFVEKEKKNIFKCLFKNFSLAASSLGKNLGNILVTRKDFLTQSGNPGKDNYS